MIQESLTEIITVVMRVQPSMLFNINVAATGRNFSYPGVAIYTGIVGASDPLTSSVVTSANSAGIELGRRIQDVIASSGLALAVNAYVKSVGATGCPVDYFVT